MTNWPSQFLNAEDHNRILASPHMAGSFSIPQAHDLQNETLNLRTARGETVIGFKVEPASEDPSGIVYGTLTERMVAPAESCIDLPAQAATQVQPALAFRFKSTIDAKSANNMQILSAIEFVTAAIEFSVSRYGHASVTDADRIADNGSAFRFALGARGVAPSTLDLMHVGCLIEIDGELATSAAGCRAFGSPLEAVVRLAACLRSTGRSIEAGHIVLVCGVADPLPVTGGQACAVTFAHLGSVWVRINAASLNI